MSENTTNTITKAPIKGIDTSAISSGCCASCSTDKKQNNHDHDGHHHDHDGHHHHHHEEMDTKIFLIRLVISFCILIAINFTELFSSHDIVELIFYIIAYLLAGYEVAYNAIRNIFKGNVFDENFLMTIASLGAFLLGERAEGVSVMIFYGVGELLQNIAVERSKKDIAQLMDILGIQQ